MNRKCKTISDVVGMTNTQVINNLLFIANNLIDFEEERFEDDADEDDSFDFENGGFGSAPKFPNPADITLLLHQAHASNQVAKAMADGALLPPDAHQARHFD